MDVGVESLHSFKQAVAVLLSSNCGAKQKWPRTVNKYYTALPTRTAINAYLS